ncbi:hypothetical protein K438DRAFT_1814572 [Mycena galopus ATCC 62051]|nr:hypothetical protein K438DRAFT_1814572 [Mycena galopus ATCC 62051]
MSSWSRMSSVHPVHDEMLDLTTRISGLEIQRAPSIEVGDSRSEPRDIDIELSERAIHRIPTELVCEIFTLTLPYTRRVGDQSLEQPPWQLGHICQSWRAAALANPLLWSTIALYAPPIQWRGQACPPMMVETQLLRSGTAPLQVIFDSRHGDIVDSCSSDSIDLVIGQSLRWETAYLHLNHPLAHRVANRLRRVTGKIPLLHHLELTSSMNFGSVLGDTFANAPSLRAVVLTDDITQSIPATTNLPWSQITTFRGSYSRSQDCVMIFKAAPNLVECGMSSASARLSDGPQIVLAHLRCLSASEHVLGSITAPSLQELWISGNPTASLLLAFIRRSSCALRKLVVYDCSEPAALIPILQAVPTLGTFFIVFARMATYTDQETLFDALKMSGGSVDVCPKLTHVAAGGPPDFALDHFLDMVESRWHGSGSPILSFMGAFYQGHNARISQDAAARIDHMRSEGLDAVVETPLKLSRNHYLGIGRP